MKHKTSGGARAGKTGKRSENKEKTKQAILAAALKLFADKGFYNTSTRAISRKVGIAEGARCSIYFENQRGSGGFTSSIAKLTRGIGWY